MQGSNEAREERGPSRNGRLPHLDHTLAIRRFHRFELVQQVDVYVLVKSCGTRSRQSGIVSVLSASLYATLESPSCAPGALPPARRFGLIRCCAGAAILSAFFPLCLLSACCSPQLSVFASLFQSAGVAKDRQSRWHRSPSTPTRKSCRRCALRARRAYALPGHAKRRSLSSQATYARLLRRFSTRPLSSEIRRTHPARLRQTAPRSRWPLLPLRNGLLWRSAGLRNMQKYRSKEQGWSYLRARLTSTFDESCRRSRDGPCLQGVVLKPTLAPTPSEEQLRRRRSTSCIAVRGCRRRWRSRNGSGEANTLRAGCQSGRREGAEIVAVAYTQCAS